MPRRLPRSAVRPASWRIALGAALTVLAGSSLLAAASTTASADVRSRDYFLPGNLLVSGSVYVGRPGLLQPGVTVLPPDCTSGCVTAISDGAYPQVFNNVLADPSFGVTSPAFLAQLTPSGRLVSILRVPAGIGRGDYMTTSFSSKSELALNLSTSGRQVTFMGYEARPDTIDASNANTPGVIDPTNPVGTAYYRVVAQVDQQGGFRFTATNAYSGDNGRAAVLNDSDGADVLYTAGNAGNGASPQPDGVIIGTGAQIITPQDEPLAAQQPGTPTPVGSFSITQLGDKIDKVGKDTNFRGLTIHDDVVYLTKGSGSNGVNTVYFIDTTGHACPDGVGLPQPGAPLPTSPLAYNPAVVQSAGLQPDNMCILQGFPTALKSATSFPFGIWFANADTLYVADEGNGDNTYGSSWQLAYTLTGGLNLGVPYPVPGYPAGNNPATDLPWAPATDGLRNLTGQVSPDGTVTIWAVTSTVSGGGDQGADPNKLIAVTDSLAARTPPAAESFRTVRAAGYGEVLRGVSFTPGTRSG